MQSILAIQISDEWSLTQITESRGTAMYHSSNVPQQQGPTVTSSSFVNIGGPVHPAAAIIAETDDHIKAEKCGADKNKANETRHQNEQYSVNTEKQ